MFYKMKAAKDSIGWPIFFNVVTNKVEFTQTILSLGTRTLKIYIFYQNKLDGNKQTKFVSNGLKNKNILRRGSCLYFSL